MGPYGLETLFNRPVYRYNNQMHMPGGRLPGPPKSLGAVVGPHAVPIMRPLPAPHVPPPVRLSGLGSLRRM